jgi:nucleoid DNA-binding protein
MKREELARKLAARKNVSRAEARDQVDEVVHKILKSLRSGRPVKLPGVGRLVSIPPPRKGPRP